MSKDPVKAARQKANLRKGWQTALEKHAPTGRSDTPYSLAVFGDPERLVEQDIIDLIESHYAVEVWRDHRYPERAPDELKRLRRARWVSLLARLRRWRDGCAKP